MIKTRAGNYFPGLKTFEFVSQNRDRIDVSGHFVEERINVLMKLEDGRMQIQKIYDDDFKPIWLSEETLAQVHLEAKARCYFAYEELKEIKDGRSATGHTEERRPD